jgi:membrane-associated protein
MRYPRFAIFNFTGAFLWAVGLPVAGYLLGEAMGEQLDRWLLVVLAVVFALSILPTAIHLYRHNRDEVHARVRSMGRRGAASGSAPPSPGSGTDVNTRPDPGLPPAE